MCRSLANLVLTPLTSEITLCLPLTMAHKACHVPQGVPGQGLSENMRKYRQSVFKLNYKIKKRRSGPEQPQSIAQPCPKTQPAIPNTAAARIASRTQSNSKDAAMSLEGDWWLQSNSNSSSSSSDNGTNTQTPLQLSAVATADQHQAAAAGPGTNNQAMNSSGASAATTRPLSRSQAFEQGTCPAPRADAFLLV